ncbi:MAG: AarF/UbiB family protein, partial [Desulfosarcinaceae bacterium]
MSFGIKSRRISNIRHFGVISRILIKHGLGEVADRFWGRNRAAARGGKAGLPDPARIRRALEELGPSFIKLGQLMSTRADIFPPDYIEEFIKLQDQVPPVPFEDIRRVIEREMRRPLVAVKVIRPGIDKRIRNDLQLMYYFTDKIEKRYELGRALGIGNIVKEFERTIFRELDMLIEAGHIERFAQSFKEIDEIYIPKVYWEHTTKSVLIMEHIDGIKMDNVAEIKRHGIDPHEVALIGLRSFSRQLMESGIFHADPHPGNTIVMYDGRVSLVDFGIVGYLDEETML